MRGYSKQFGNSVTLNDISSVMLKSTCYLCNYNVGTSFLSEVNCFSSRRYVQGTMIRGRYVMP
jgi:hypothetical protein